MAAMLHSLLLLVRGIRERRPAHYFELLGAMIHSIDTCPERLHLADATTSTRAHSNCDSLRLDIERD